jgi:hypothetical protein
MTVNFEHQRRSTFQITVAPTHSRGTGRAGNGSRSPQLSVTPPEEAFFVIGGDRRGQVAYNAGVRMFLTGQLPSREWR